MPVDILNELEDTKAILQFRTHPFTCLNGLPVNFQYYHQCLFSGIVMGRAGLSGVRVPAGAGNFSLHHRIQTGSGAHPASYPMGTRGCFPGGKAAVV
jgi:hypothetical protein